MGIIQRQGIKHSIVNFTGLAISTLSTIFLYSQNELVEPYGLIQYFLSFAVVGFPLFSMASGSVGIRFFPVFEDKENGHNGLFSLLMIMCLLGWGIVATIAFCNWGTIELKLASNSNLRRQFLWMAFPITLLYTLAVTIYQYNVNFKRIVVPTILFDLSLKIVLPIILLVLLFGWIDLQMALWLLVAHFCFVIIGLLIYLNHRGELFWRFNWSFLKPELRKEIGRYIGFSVATGLALLLATKADTLMVGSMASMKNTGIYVIALNISAAMEIPNRSLLSASISFVSKYLTDENWTELQSLYQKVSINLLTAGLFVFGCIWVSADDLYALITLVSKNVEISEGKYVLLLLSLAKLLDMSAGLNNQMVYYSKYYRFSMVALVVLAVANIGFNIWIIPRWGITGAAFAALLSISCYNLFNLYVVWKKFKMQPFSRNTILVVVLAMLSIGAVYYIPATGFSFLNIIIRAGLFALIFSILVIRFKVSEDISSMWDGFVARFFSAKI